MTFSPRWSALAGALLDDRARRDNWPRRRRPASAVRPTEPGTGRGRVAHGPTDPSTQTLLTTVIDRPVPRVVVVRVGGELDMSSAPDLERVLDRLLSGSPPYGLVLDLTELTFLGCRGIATLVDLHDRTTEGETSTALHLVGLRPAVARALAMTGVLAMFFVHDTVGSVVHSLR